MKSKKDLAKYLADYVEYEVIEGGRDYLDVGAQDIMNHLSDYIEQGLEAFESTEAVETLFVSEEMAHSIKDLIEQAEEDEPDCGDYLNR